MSDEPRMVFTFDPRELDTLADELTKRLQLRSLPRELRSVLRENAVCYVPVFAVNNASDEVYLKVRILSHGWEIEFWHNGYHLRTLTLWYEE